MQTITLPKIDGVSNQPAAEMNSVFNELQNAITNSGQSLNGSDLNQIGKAMATYVAEGDYYVDSGVANAYVLTAVSPLQAPPAYANGMRIRFLPANSNSGASTINVQSLGVINIKREDGSNPAAFDIRANLMTELYIKTGSPNIAYLLVPYTENTLYTDTGTANNYSITVPGISALTPGQIFSILITHPNTGASTLTINSLSAVSITKQTVMGVKALVGNELQLNVIYRMQWDGTQIQLLNPSVIPSYSYSVYTQTSRSVPNGGSPSLLVFDLIDFIDPYGLITYSTLTNAFTVNKTGRYEVSAAISIQNGSVSPGGALSLQVNINGTSYQRLGEQNYYNEDITLTGDFFVPLNAGDLITLTILNYTAGNMTTLIDTSGANAAFPLFQIEYLGA